VRPVVGRPSLGPARLTPRCRAPHRRHTGRVATMEP
jgi:hypothetical protein